MPKQFSKSLFAAMAIALLFSCTINEYEKGEGKWSMMTADIADIDTDDEGKVNKAVTDDGVTLQFTAPFKVKWMEKKDTTYRVLLYYKEATSNSNPSASVPMVEPVSVGRVLVARPGRAKGSVKTDPVGVESIWKGRNGRYLNMGLIIKTGTAEGDSARQTLGVITDTIIKSHDGKQTFHATLYHDQGGVPEYYSQRTFLSIPLDSIKADSLRIEINTYDGKTQKSIPLHE